MKIHTRPPVQVQYQEKKNEQPDMPPPNGIMPPLNGIIPDYSVPLRRDKRSSGFQYRQPQPKVDEPFIPQPVLKAEYGTLFQHHGSILQNLQRKYLVVAIDLPKISDLDTTVPEFPLCNFFGARPIRHHAPIRDIDQLGNEMMHQDLCFQLEDLSDSWFARVEKLRFDLRRKINESLAAILPNPVYTIDGVRVIRLPNGTYLQEKDYYHKHGSRQKRGIGALIVAGLSHMGGLVIRGLNAYIDSKKNKAMVGALEVLYDNQDNLHGQIKIIQNRTTAIAESSFQALTAVKQELRQSKRQMNETNASLHAYIHAANRQFKKTYLTLNNHELAIGFIQKFLYLYIDAMTTHKDQLLKYERRYEQLAYAIDQLASGRLTHVILEPDQLQLFLEAFEDDLYEHAPNYELVFQNVYDYYAYKMVAFTNTPSQLVVQLPLLLKLKVQVPMSLYHVETVPVPLDENTYRGLEQHYTQIQVSEDYLAMTPENYIPMSHAQLRLCFKLANTYYCEHAHLLRFRTQHTCASAIYYNEPSSVIADHCTAQVHLNIPPTPRVLDAGTQLVLSNLPAPWTLVCKPNNRPFQIEYSTYRIINRTELCECSLSARNFMLEQSTMVCGASEAAKDGFFTTYYAINKIIFDYLTVKFDIDIATDVMALLDKQQEGIPFYDLPNLDIFQPGTNDVVLDQSTDAAISDLEVVLTHMISEDQNELFVSDQSFAKGQRTFKRYIKHAKWWQAASTLCSWIGIVLSAVSLFALSYWFCINKKYIMSLISGHYASMEISTDYVVVPKPASAAPVPTMPPLITLNPKIFEETEDEFHEIAGTQLATMICVLIIVILMVTTILYAVFKRCRHASSLVRAAFPLYPLSRILRGKYRSDIFLEITNRSKGNTLWAHLKAVGLYPTSFTVNGQLTIEDIEVTKCCCFKMIRINWRDVHIMDYTGKIHVMPNTTWLSILTESDLTNLNPEDAYDIRILGRILDHIMEIPKATSPAIEEAEIDH